MFNEKSGLVEIWVGLLSDKDSDYGIDDIPDISNLRSVVLSLIQK